MVERIWFVTGNEHKARIFQEVMGSKFEIERLTPKEDIKEKRSNSVRDVVEDKLSNARKMFPEKEGFLFVTDVGFYIDGLDGRPGALIKRRTEERFDEDFTQWCDALSEGSSRDATVRMIIGAESNEGDRFFVEHDLEGRIPEKSKKGGHGFAWDKVFVPNWEEYGKKLGKKSLDQVEPEDKFDVLMKPAIEDFREELTET